MTTEPDMISLQDLPEYLQSLGYRTSYKTCWKLLYEDGWPGVKFSGKWVVSKTVWRRKLESMAAEKPAARSR